VTIQAIVTDIEGTTSSIAFVHDVLFPYASDALPDFVRQYQDEPNISAILEQTRRDADMPEADVEETICILLTWIDEDRKATPLKELQGYIWQHGYESGAFTGHIYDDAATRLRQWADDGVRLFIYSSGSVGAQKLLFGFSDAGDLTSLFEDYFDTRIGHKKSADAYRAITASIGLPAADILFLSDVAEELDAAHEAGMRPIQLIRDSDVIPGVHPIASDFDDVQSVL